MKLFGDKKEEKPSQPVWELASTHPHLVEPLRAALREIQDPEIGLNVIELGLIRNVHLQDGQALVNMILTTPYCPYGPAMLEATRQKAEQALNVPTRIDLGMEAWDFSMMEEGAAPDWGMY